LRHFTSIWGCKSRGCDVYTEAKVLPLLIAKNSRSDIKKLHQSDVLEGISVLWDKYGVGLGLIMNAVILQIHPEKSKNLIISLFLF